MAVSWWDQTSRDPVPVLDLEEELKRVLSRFIGEHADTGSIARMRSEVVNHFRAMDYYIDPSSIDIVFDGSDVSVRMPDPIPLGRSNYTNPYSREIQNVLRPIVDGYRGLNPSKAIIDEGDWFSNQPNDIYYQNLQVKNLEHKIKELEEEIFNLKQDRDHYRMLALEN